MISPNSPLQPFVQYEEGLLSQISTLQQQVNALTTAGSTKDSQIQGLTTQVGSLQSQLDTATTQITSFTKQVAELTRQLKVQRVIGAALTFDFENIPYEFGGTYEKDKTFDCSALAQTCFKIGAEISLPRVSREQATVGQDVTFDQIEAGDLIFYDFNHDGTITHVAIAIGNGQIIQTNTPATGINIQSTSWNQGSIVKIKRVILS